MPAHDLRCLNCGQIFEVTISFSEELPAVHEACGGSVKKIISTISWPAFPGSAAKEIRRYKKRMDANYRAAAQGLPNTDPYFYRKSD